MLRSEDDSASLVQARLVELAQARDSAAFTTLYLLHTPGICGYLLGLVDFGIAKEFVEDKTTNVIRHGSPGYAAPEQYGGGTNPQTDLYGLGATLYTMLTGVIPPDAITRASRRKELDPLRPANLLVPGIPPGVAEAIERAISISIDDRFETIEQFWQELHGDPRRNTVF